MAVSVPIDFEGRFDQALKNFDKFAGDVEKRLGGVQSAFSGIETVAKTAFSFFAVGKIVDGIESIVEAAAESEKALAGLSGALQSAGDFSEQNLARFQALAEQIQANTKFDDDLVISQFAIAKRFNATNEEAEKLVNAAVELASATGIDLNSATELLGKSLDGTAGKLNELVPEIRNLTAEQLAAGEAIGLVAERFQGAAEKELKTFGGAIAQLQNNTGNFVEDLGDLIVKNDAVKTAIAGVSKVVGVLRDIFKENRAEIRNFVSGGVLFAVNAFGVFVESLRIVDRIIVSIIAGIRSLAFGLETIGRFAINLAKGDLNKAFSVDQASLQRLGDSLERDNASLQAREQIYDKVSTAVAEVSLETEKAAEAQAKVTDEVEKTVKSFDGLKPKVGRISQEIIAQFKALEAQTKNFGATERDVLVNQLNSGIETVDRALKAKAITQERGNAVLLKLATKFNKDIAAIEKKETEERLKEQADNLSKTESAVKAHQDRLKNLLQNPLGDIFETGPQALDELTLAIQGAVARGLGVVGAVLQGAPGATKLLSGVAENLGQAFLGVPGIGALFESLAQGPDKVRQMVREFARAVPQIIDAVVKAIPVFVVELVRAIPTIIDGFVDAIPELIDALADAFSDPSFIERLAVSIATAFPRAFLALQGKLLESAVQFTGRILEGAGQFVGKILEGAGQFIQKILDGIGSAGSNLLPKLPGAGGGGINLGGAAGLINGGLPGLAAGNIVGPSLGLPSLPSLPSLSFKGGAQAAQADEGPSRITVPIQIGNRQLADAIIDLDRLGYRLVRA